MRHVRAFVFALAVFGLADGAQAVTKQWTNAGGTGNSQWTDPLNWNPNGVPGPGDDVQIGVNGTAGNCVLTSNASILSLTILDPGTPPNLTVNGAVTLTVSGATNVASGNTIAAASGATININGGGSSTGQFSSGASSIIAFNGGYTANSGSTFTGAGEFRINNGLFLAPAAITIPNLRLSGGVLAGTGTVTLTGAAIWSGGRMGENTQPPGTTIIDSAATLSIPGGAFTYLERRTLTNNGTINYVGAGQYLTIQVSSTLNNVGTFDLQSDQIIWQSGAGPNVFVNSGTLQKSAGAATSVLHPEVVNTGTIAVTSGVISMVGGGSSTGAFSAGLGSNVQFASNYTLNTGTTFSGAGGFRISFGNLVVPTGASVTIPNFSILNGSSYLSGAGTVTLTGAATWAGGAMGHPSSPGGTTIVAPGATLAIDGSASYATLDQNRTLTNNGTIDYTATSYYLSIYNASTLNNAGTFNIATDQDIQIAGSTPNVFDNSGTLQKTAGTGVSQINATVVNSGTIAGNSGTLSVGGGGSGTGGFVAGASAIVDFASAYTASAGSTFGGSGSFRINAGNLVVPSPAAVTIPNLTILSGYLSGSGTVTLSGAVVWSGGYMGHPSFAGGATIVDPGATLAINSSYAYLDAGRTLTNNGTINYAPAGTYLSIYNGSTISNAGTFNLLNDQAINIGGSGPNTFNNSGTLQKTAGAGTSTIFAVTNNSGTVTSTSGEMSLNGGGTHSGSFNAGAVATLAFGGGTHDVAATAVVSALGTIKFSAGTVDLAGTYTVSGTTRITGGTARFNSISSTDILTMSGGILGGTSTFTIDTSSTWSGGTMNGPGTTSIAPAASLLLNGASTYSYLDNGRTLTNFGTITYSAPAQYFSIYNGSTLDNSGLFDIQTDQDIYASAVGNVFINTGTLRKSAGTGTSILSAAVNNSGLLEVQSGTIALQGGGTAGGSFSFSASLGATVDFTSTYTLTTAGAFLGPGAYRINNGNLVVAPAIAAAIPNLSLVAGYLSGGGTVTLMGTATWAGGSMGHSANPGGTTIVDSAATLNLTNTTYKYLDQGRTLTNNGTINYNAATYYLSIYNGSTLNNIGLFDIQSDIGISVSGAGNAFNNSGTLLKSAGAGVSAISVPVNNTGGATSTSGTLELRGGGTHTGTFVAGPSATFEFGGGNHASSSGSYSGAGTIAVTGGSVVLSSTTTYLPSATQVTGGSLVLNVSGTTGSLTQSGGYLGGSGTFTITGSATWSGGTWGEPTYTGGTTVIDPAATVLLSGATTYSYLGYGRTLNNNGTIVYSAATYYLTFYQTATLNNAGTFDAQTNQGIFQSGGVNLFANTGTLQKSGGTGLSTINIAVNNSGSVAVTTGTLSFNGGGTHTGSFAATSPATMQFNGGTHSSATGSYSGTGTFAFMAGTVVLSGTTTYNPAATRVTNGTAVLNVNGTTASLDQSGGYLGGSGTLTLTGSVLWSGGTWGEPTNLGGTTIINPGVTVNLTGSTTYSYIGYGRTLNNNGTIVYSAPTYYLTIYQGGTLNNVGTFTVQTDQGIFSSGAGNLFVNGGTLEKTSGTGTSTISPPFQNAGSVTTSTGTLSFNGPGTHTGSFLATAPGIIRFGGGTSSSTTGSYGGTGAFVFAAGNITLSGTTTYNATTTDIASATVVMNVNGDTTALNQTGGYLGGTGTFTITGSATWTGGTWGAPATPGGTTVVDPAALVTLSGATTYSYLGYGRTLNNGGTIIYTAPTYYFTFYQGGVLNNAGTFDVQTDQGLQVSGASNQFVNTGTFQKSAGAATSTFSVPFSNSGAVNALAGVSAFNGGYTQTAGTLTLNGGNVSSTTPFAIQGGVVTGSGTMTGALTNGGTIQPGLSPGTIAITGNYTQTATGVLNVEIAGAASADLLAVTGTATLNGTLNVLNIGGYTPANGAGFQIITYASRSGDFAAKTGLAYVGGAYTYNLNATDITLTAGSTADVTVSKSAPATVAVNQTFNYTIVVSNVSGTDAATNVTVTDDLAAAGVALNSVAPAAGWTCTGTTTVTCTASLLAASASETFTFNVTAPGSPGSITNTAAVAAVNEPAPNNGNNSSAAVTSVVAVQADLSLAVASIASTTSGNPVVYTVTVNNAGPVSATNVVVTATIPPGVTGVSFSTSPAASCSPSGLTVVCTFPAIASGGSAGITFNTTAADGGTMTLTAQVSGAEPDPNATNNSASGTTLVTGANTLVVRTAGDAGSSTLRQALADTQSGLCVTPCTITFAIPGPGPHAILPATPLPTVSANGVTIDGATQPGYSGQPLIHLNGALLSPGSTGIYAFGTSWTVRAVAVFNVPGYGMFFSGGSGHNVLDCYLGTDGTADLGNLYEGLLFSGSSNTIRGNVISGNARAVRFFGTSTGNLVAGNRIGVAADGTTSLPNSNGAIWFQSAASGSVGGTATADANIIANNGGPGILIDSGVAPVEILGNSFSANSALAIDDAAGVGNPPTPSISSAELSGGNLHVTLSADATTAAGTTSIRVEVYRADSLASGEGTLLLTSNCLAGNLLTSSIITVPAGSVTAGTPIVATATPYGSPSCSGITANTSEFSAAVAAAACTPPPVTISASGPTGFCAPGSVTLTAMPAGLAYLWSTGATSQSITVSATGNYTVTATNAVGCAGSASQSVTVYPVPPTPTVTPSGPTAFCTGGSVTLSAPAGFASYLWSNGAIGQTITVSAAGSYSVTVTNANGCSATSAPANVTVNPPPSAPTITASGPTSFCQGGSVTLTASAGSSYLWSNGASTPSITVTSGGSYTVTVTDANGCSATSAPAAVTVTSPPLARISGPSAFCGVGTATLTVAGTGISSVSWSTGETSMSITVSPTSTTTYTVTVAAGSCTTTVSHTITVTNAGPPLGISAPASVVALSTGNVAIAAGDPAAFYTWSIFNGVITAGQGTPSITFTAGERGSVLLNVSTDNAGCASNGTTSVAIDECATQPPSLLSPPAGTTSATSPVTFAWTAVAGALEYEVWRIVDGTSPALVGSTTATTLTANVPSGSYVWYVTARLQPSCSIQRLSSTEVRAITVVPQTNCPSVAPGLVSPASGSTPFSPVTFDWTGVPDAIGYRVMASLGGLPPIELDSTDADTTELIAEVPVGPVSWWVEALYPGCPGVPSALRDFHVELEDCAKHDKASLLSPANESIAPSSAVTFSWSPVDGADGYALWSILDEGPSKIGETLGATSLTAVVPFGRREWYVETLFEGCPSTESDHRFLQIPASSGCATTAPGLIAPSDAALVTSPLVTFSWSSISRALIYELWLSVGGGAEALISSTAATSLTTEVPAGEISWFVRARIDGCPNVDSSRRALRYQPPAGCSTMVPMPILPMDDGRPVTSPVAFRWTAVPGATQYKLYLRRGNGAPDLKATTTFPAADGIVAANGESRWFVEAVFNGCPPTRSSESRFVAVPSPSSCIDLAAPVLSLPGQVSAGTPYTVHWTGVPGAESYLLTEFIGSTARTISVDGQSASFVYRNDSPDGHIYVYRVRGVDENCDVPREGALSMALGISILPERSAESSALVGSQAVAQHVIPIGPEFAGQTFTATARQPWISIVPSSGLVPAGGIDLVVSADATGLPLGTSLGTVMMSFGGGSAGRTVTHANGPVTAPISVSLVTPMTPNPKSTPPPDALIIPAVAHADGINAQFRSDVRVSNTSPQVMKYQMTFIPSGDSGITQGRQTTLDIEPGRTIALDDVLRSWFGTGGANIIGTLEVRPLTQSNSSTSSAAVRGLPNFVTFASSRTFNQTPGGTFGTYIAAIPFANFIGRSTESSKSVLSMQQIAQSSLYRTNIGFVEGSGNPVELLVSVFTTAGVKVTEFPVALTGGQHLQMNSFLGTRGIQLDDGRLEVKVTTGSGRVTSYASVVNNATGDSLVVTPTTLGQGTSKKYVLPGVAELSGGVVWQTDMRLFNAGGEPVTASLTLQSLNGTPPRQASVELAPGEVKQLDRVLPSLFGVSNDGGALHITTEGDSSLVATARTFRPAGDGANFGQFIQAVTPDQAIALGSRPLQLLQIEESPRFRSNVGIAEVSGKAAKVEVTVIPPDAKVSAKIEIDLAANQFRQLNSLLSAMGLTDTHNARVTVKVVSGQGRVTAYAATIDAITQDPTFIPAQ